MKTLLALGFFQVNRRPKESVQNDANTSDDFQGESKYSFRVGKQISQRADSHATVKLHILSELLGACGIRLVPDAPDWTTRRFPPPRPRLCLRQARARLRRAFPSRSSRPVPVSSSAKSSAQ